MNSDASKFAAWLKMHLRMLGMTQAGLAEKLGVTPSTVTKWINAPSRMNSATRHKLATLLRVQVGDLPVAFTDPIGVKSHEASAKQTIFLWGVCDGIPDHALTQLAAEQGFFRNECIEYVDWSDSDYPLPRIYPARQQSLCKHFASNRRGDFALVAGQKSSLGDCVADAEEIATTNFYNGFSAITTSTKPLNSVHLAAIGNKTGVFKALFETILERGIGGAERSDTSSGDHRRSRIACLGKLERQFMYLAHELHLEILGVKKFTTPLTQNELDERAKEFAGTDWAGDSESTESVELLDALDEVGVKARDIIVGDALTLALALANPQRYKVLCTFKDIKHVVRELNETNLSTISRLKTFYPGFADNKALLAAFREFWNLTLNMLESEPVCWYLMRKSGVDGRIHEDLKVRLSRVARRVVEYLVNTQAHALLQLMEITTNYRQGTNSSLDKSALRPTFASFARAWEECYVPHLK